MLSLDGDESFGDVKSWMFSDGDDWTNLQKTTQNISEILETLEENVKIGYEDLNKKNSEYGKFIA